MSKNLKIIKYIILIVSWLSVPFIGKKAFLRFLPSATFVALLFSIESELAISKRWWKINGRIFKNTSTAISFVFGPFLIASIWVMKLTYKRFSLYMFSNIIMDCIFSFVLSPIFERMKVYTLIKFKRSTIFWNFIIYALFMYWYQIAIEKGILYQFKNRDENYLTKKENT